MQGLTFAHDTYGVQWLDPACDTHVPMPLSPDAHATRTKIPPLLYHVHHLRGNRIACDRDGATSDLGNDDDLAITREQGSGEADQKPECRNADQALECRVVPVHTEKRPSLLGPRTPPGKRQRHQGQEACQAKHQQADALENTHVPYLPTAMVMLRTAKTPYSIAQTRRLGSVHS